jgi:hypothetical protein
MNRYKLLLLTLTAVFTVACGGGGGGGLDIDIGAIGGGGKAKVTIENALPMHSPDITKISPSRYETTRSSVGLSGDGFISPEKANCSDNLPQKLSISWRNAANGSSGVGRSTAGCLSIIVLRTLVSSWTISQNSIPLELGANKITVTASDSQGKSRSDSVKVIRKQGPAAASSAGVKFDHVTSSEGSADFVTLQYPSIWDVHSAYPTEKAISQDRTDASQPGHFLNGQIFAELGRWVEASAYDFVLLYSLTELPGGTSLISPCVIPASNIGFDNSKAGVNLCPDIPASWSKLRAVPHMNTVSYVDNNREFPHGPWDVLMSLNRMGHAWGAYWALDGVNSADWKPQQHSPALLACYKRFWTSADHWFEDGLPGLMGSTPSGSRFNAFDLYAMGLMDYQEVANYQYLIHTSSDESTLYPLTIEDLIDQLRQTGGNYYTGNGRRNPSTDASVSHLNALLVLVTGSDEVLGDTHRAALLKIAGELPEAWHTATWGRSTMSTEVLLR